MAERTGIEWADATWNPWMGCKKVSPGCKNCYMFRDMTFYGRDPNIVVKASEASFRNPLKWAKNGKLKTGARIFTCSWSDWFIDKADEWREDAWRIIKLTPQFNYLILTKRPERIADHLPPDWGKGYKNVWLLVSAENQQTLEERLEFLLDIPAAIRGVSAEPLLGPITFWRYFPQGTCKRPVCTQYTRLNSKYENGIHWVITGGESDKKSPRLTDPEWVRAIRDECIKAHVAFFHKQHGGTKKIDDAWGGRLLDGREWNEFPTVESNH